MKDSLPDERADRAIARLRELQGPTDPEAAHSLADDILCDLLIELNFDDVVAEWRKVEKWYA
ncbi:hypothetical protein [Sinorhizobium medicae]